MSSLLLLAQESTIHHSGKWFLDHAWIIPAVPAASFVLILFTGKRWKYKGAEIGIAALSIAFALALCVGFQWIQHTNDAHHEATTEEHALSASGAGTGVLAAEEEHEEIAVTAVESTTTWFEN